MGEKINSILKGEIISSIFYILLGLCLILIPTQTVDVICKVVFGLILIGVGIYHIYIYIRGKVTATIMDLLSGVMMFVLGVFLFMTPSIVIKILPWMLSAFVLVDSLWKFKGAFLLKKGGHGAWSVLLIGSLVFIALGIVMLFGKFPKIMTLLIFSGWVLVCDGAADIVFFIIMKLGLRKIRKKSEAEAEKEKESQEHAEENGEDSRENAEENPSVQELELTETEPEKTPETAPEPAETGSTEMPAEDKESEDAADQFSDGSQEAEVQEEQQPKPEIENTRWEKEPESAEMKLRDAGKDQAETGNLKDFLNSSDDEELEEWKD